MQSIIAGLNFARSLPKVLLPVLHNNVELPTLCFFAAHHKLCPTILMGETKGECLGKMAVVRFLLGRERCRWCVSTLLVRIGAGPFFLSEEALVFHSTQISGVLNARMKSNALVVYFEDREGNKNAWGFRLESKSGILELSSMEIVLPAKKIGMFFREFNLRSDGRFLP